jgi:hypothetical protein
MSISLAALFALVRECCSFQHSFDDDDPYGVKPFKAKTFAALFALVRELQLSQLFYRSMLLDGERFRRTGISKARARTRERIPLAGRSQGPIKHAAWIFGAANLQQSLPLAYIPEGLRP